MNQLTASVTHFVASRNNPDHLRVMSTLDLKPYKVSLQWIVESMLMGQPVPESDFPIATVDNRSVPQASCRLVKSHSNEGRLVYTASILTQRRFIFLLY
jgi:hypothetical protein